MADDGLMMNFFSSSTAEPESAAVDPPDESTADALKSKKKGLAKKVSGAKGKVKRTREDSSKTAEKAPPSKRVAKGKSEGGLGGT